MIKNNLKLITIITLIFFSSFGVKAEKLTSLEQIMKEDDPKHLSYVMMRCASLQLVLSFLLLQINVHLIIKNIIIFEIGLIIIIESAYI